MGCVKNAQNCFNRHVYKIYRLSDDSRDHEQRRHFIPPRFFNKEARVNSVDYIELLSRVEKLRITSVARERLYILKQDSLPSHRVHTAQ